MKKLLFLVLLFSFSLLQAQMYQDDFDPDYDYGYFHDVSFETGIQPALQQGNTDFLVIFYKQISTSWYYTEKKGFTTGMLYTDQLECVKNLYAVPLYFSYRSRMRNDFYIGGSISSLSDLFFGILFAILPRRFEVHAGPGFYYIEPENSLSTWSNGIKTYQKGYKTERSLGISLDAGTKMTYQIWRIGVFGRFDLSYLPTRNFKYFNTLEPDKHDQPSFFLKAGVGASINF